MTKAEIKLVINIVKDTTAFRTHHIDYKVGDREVRVWGIESNDENFYYTQIIQLFESPFCTFVTYDPERAKCVLVIF